MSHPCCNCRFFLPRAPGARPACLRVPAFPVRPPKAKQRRGCQRHAFIIPERQEDCAECEGGGWVLASYQGSHAPNLETCPTCGNEEGFPCP